jgi:ABC-type Fe3+ transport system substrate-binding protein
MNTKTQRFVGLGLLLVAAVALVVTPFLLGQARPTVAVKGLSGGGKLGLLANPEVREILRQRYGLTVEVVERGSMAMVEGDTTGQDFLWPGSEAAIERYLARGGKPVRSDSIFASPLVLYSWDVVTDGLERAGVAKRHEDSHYSVDLPRLIRLGDEGKTWKDLGLPQLHGRVSVFTSDPTKSNGGAMFAALLAAALNGNEVVDEGKLGAVLPGVKQYYDRLGMLDATTADLFDKFLRTGAGANPIIVGYEQELIEFLRVNPAYRQLLNEKVRVLYPEPTVWASSPFIALTPNGARLLDALADKEILRLAWERHGFRSGPRNDPKALGLVGVPETVDSVMPIPKAVVIDQILAALK